jgi:hypothetical protein
LAQKVLRGQTRGYVHHPQLIRFREQADPVATISAYLREVQNEAAFRGYRFDASKIVSAAPAPLIAATEGQLFFEWQHLLDKLRFRSPALYEKWKGLERPDAHPLFSVEAGPVAHWERGEV